MPKLYFCDTALCAYLSKWLSVETLMNGAASGHYYENYVVMEFVKTYAYSKAKATFRIIGIQMQRKLIYLLKKMT